MTEEEAYKRFLQAVDDAGGIRAFGRLVGFTPSYISDIVHNRRPLSEAILAKIGIEKVVVVTTTYRDLSDTQTS